MRAIGSLQVSEVGLGCNNFGRRLDPGRTAEVVHAALDAGITLFDTADIYGDGQSEEYLGRALAGRRAEAVIATKVGMRFGGDPQRDGAHPDYVRASCHDSLRRLGVDHIDLYQIHRPDPTVPIADTLGALSELVEAGLVREVGYSNASRVQIDEADDTAVERGLRGFCSVQNEYSLLHREPETDGVLDACAERGLAFLPFFPLASGMLTGKYRRDQPAPAGSRLAGMKDTQRERWASERNLVVVERLQALARDRGWTMVELAVSWLLTRETVASVIAGATSPDQVRDNVAAGRLHLAPEDLAVIDEITTAGEPGER
jgi:aryl-alcohol dehydrogenase-like predicted oxidoreductase